MKKVIVIGCPGAGKTTFAEKLAKKTGLPLYYLDAIWHKSDRTHIPREEFDARLGDILDTEKWIIDGDYSRTLERRMRHCDTVFLFDFPKEVCLQGVISRLGVQRSDMPWVDTELDPLLLDQVERFADEKLPTVYSLFEKYGDKQIIIFKSRTEADEYIKKA